MENKIIIDKHNCEMINTKNVYIHDDIFISLQFYKNIKKLILQLKKYGTSFIYSIEFINVIGIEMTACDFWGASECVLDFEYIDLSEQALIPKLQNKLTNNCNPFNAPYKNYIETLITFTSGDLLRIACETIIVNNPIAD